jgi:cation diffusion facilitator family transporter
LSAARQNIRTQKWVLIVSVVLLTVKLVAYFLTQSVAILTDALESIVNVVAAMLGFYSLHLSAKPRDTDHPYGHGKIEFLSAAAEGLMILVAGIFIVIEAIGKIIDPAPLQQLDVGLLLISVTAAINFLMGSICLKIGRQNKSLALTATGNHLHTDTYSTIGVVAGLVLLSVTGIVWLDSAVAMIMSGIILYTGFKIIRTSVAGIMDERDKVLLGEFITVVDRNRSKNWVDLHNLRIIKYGSTLHLDCHLTVPWYLNVHEAHDEVAKLRDIAEKTFGPAIEMFVHSDGCVPTSCPICIKDDCPVRYHHYERRIEWTVQNIQADRKHHAET